MKLSLFPSVTLALIISFFGGCAPDSATTNKPIILTYSIFFPPSHVQAKLAGDWAKEIEQRSGGKIKMMLFAGGSLTKADQCFQGVVDGITSIGMSAFAYTRGRFPLLEGLDLPVGYLDGASATAIADQLIRKYHPKELQEVHFLYAHAHGPGVLASAREEIDSLEKLSGLKIRATGFSARMVDHLGASPIGMPQGDTYEALQKGVVDATFCPIETLKGWKQGEVIHSVTDSKCVGYTTTFFVVMNLEEWESLPPDVQKIFDAVSKEWVPRHGQAWNAADQAGLDFIQGLGRKFVSLSPSEQQAWVEKIKPMLKEYADRAQAKNLPGNAFLADLLNGIKQAKSAQKGNP